MSVRAAAAGLAGALLAALALPDRAVAGGPPSAFRVSPGVMQRLRGADGKPAPDETPAAAKARAEAEPVNEVAGEASGTLGAGHAGALAEWDRRGKNVTDRPWYWVVLHHTATDGGDVAAIHRAHRRRRDAAGNPWRGIGYHFLIGNGAGMPDGAVEPTFRWRGQLSGAHAGRRDENARGVGVCLVGDFRDADPTPAQLASARRLIAFLRDRYGIPADRVVPHGAITVTACPGERLTVETLLEPDPPPPAEPAPAAEAEAAAEPEAAGLSAPAEPAGPSLAAPALPSPPRFGAHDAP